MTEERADTAGVRVPPPLIFFVPLAVGLLLSHWAPTEYVDPSVAHWTGGALIAIGLAVALSAVYNFGRAGTNLRPDRPSSALVRTGPYRFTRNPMYLSMTIVYLGVALMMQSVWSFLLLPLVIALIQTQVIRREEAYMERRFGAEYVRFKRKVRRWI